MTTNLARKLKSIHNHDCKKCNLHRSSEHVCLMGRGKVTGRPIMMLGEAPGRNEALTGQVFSGASGKLLDRLIEELGLTPHVFITNPVKCRPPENRAPTNEEIQVCATAYFAKELDIIRPRLIVALGRVPMGVMAWGDRINPVRGRVFELDSIMFGPQKILFTYHPAYCLRVGQNGINDLRKHLTVAKEFMGI